MKIEKEKVLESILELPSETKVKAWMFQIEKNFYQVASYSLFRLGDKISIWEANKNGKRKQATPIFTINGKDHLMCIEKFVEELENREQN